MRVDTTLNQDQVGKFLLVRATPDRSLIVKVISISDDLVGFSVLDPSIPTRSAKVRFKKDVIYSFYDTEPEAAAELKKLQEKGDSA